MRQELKNLRLAVDKEEGRPLKAPKADKGPGLGSGGPGGEEAIKSSDLYIHCPPEKSCEEKWEEEEGERSDPGQVEGPAAHALRCVGEGVQERKPDFWTWFCCCVTLEKLPHLAEPLTLSTKCL